MIAGGFWQSKGSKGSHWIRLTMQPDIVIQWLQMRVSPRDNSYMPSLVKVKVGQDLLHMHELNAVNVKDDDTVVTLLRNCSRSYSYIEIDIANCKNNGIDCRIHGLSVLGRRQLDVPPLYTTHSYLAAEDEDEARSSAAAQPGLTAMVPKLGLRDTKTHVFVWGLNDKDQLGGPKGSKIKIPSINESLSSLNCLQIVGGAKSLFCVTEGGKLFACGEATHGRLALGISEGSVSIPRQVLAISQYVVKKVAVHSGGRHAMALTVDGKVFSWGEGDDGKLGHFSRTHLDVPKLIEALRSKRVRDIACGSAHSAAIISNGDLYTWGIGEYGRLGHGDTVTQLRPKQVKALAGQRVVQVALGSRDAQSMALTEDGTVYSWGDGDFGKLGRGGSEGCLKPELVTSLKDKGVCFIECGAQFSAALTKSGEVYTWGKGDYCRLGHGNDHHVRRPQLVEGLMGKKVVQLAIGALHCLAVTDTGQVYAWGDNDHGQQGNQTTSVNSKPTLVQGLEGYHITKVSCGSSHSIAWCTSDTRTPVSHDPVLFTATEDPLGATTVTSSNLEENMAKTSMKIHKDQPSLAQIILSHDSRDAKFKALKEVLEALYILTAREAVVNVLKRDSPILKDPTCESTLSSTDLSSQRKYQGAMHDIMSGQDISGSFHSLAKASPSTSIVAETFFTTEQITNNEQSVSSTQDQDDLSLTLTPDSARIVVDLLKLGVAGRAGEIGCRTLVHVLKSLANKHAQVCEMLLELCVTELEDAASHKDMMRFSEEPIVQESPHPYLDECLLTGTVKVPGAEALRVEFDAQCSTEPGHDRLWIMTSSGKNVCVKSGREWSDWSQEVVVKGDELRWKFSSDASVNGWGWRFLVYPVQPSVAALDCLSDRCVLSRPSLQLVRCLLDCLNLPPTHQVLPRLAAALATCAQINSLEGSQRMWALHKLRQIINKRYQYGVVASEPLTPLKDLSALSGLIQSLPDVLRRQYEYEEPLVRSGKHLMHSNFFKELVALGGELNIDTLSQCLDVHKWQWLRRYCLAARTAHSLSQRVTLPVEFTEEVQKKVLEVTNEGESLAEDHLDHCVFKEEHDQQLLLWANRKPEDWVLSWGGSGQVWGWGHNHRGQLGGVAGAKVKAPSICDSVATLQPMHIAGGEQTLFVVSADGKVYSTGFGAGGRLGTGSSESVNIPTLLETLRHVLIRKVSVNSGGKHCLALSAQGEVYSWGEGEDGKLGHGNRTSYDRPQVIENLRGKEIMDIAAGGAHSACISSEGHLYTWGKGRYGRLGHGDSDDQTVPKMVETLRGYVVKDVSCGSGDAQTLCLTADEVVWSWGDGDYGKLGRGGSDGVKIPMQVDALNGLGVCAVLCGSQFSVALTKSGAVYTWGKGDYHRLGHGRDEHVRKPRRVHGLEGKKVMGLACGSLHCIACTDTGEVYTWGDNDEGQLGDGSTNAIPSPKQLNALKGKKITRVACGSAHTIAWSTNKPQHAGHLPACVPIEYNHLCNLSLMTLRNRLILLHYFSDMFSPCIPMFSLDDTPRADTMVTSGSVRGVLTLASKESAFRKVIQNTMLRDRQHGPVIEINRLQVKRYRSKKGVAGPDGCRSVFGQMCSKMCLFDTECLMLPHRVWKVKFVGESVDDCGGGYSESIAEMCDELQNGSVPLLIQTPNGREENGSNRDCFLLNPTLTGPQHVEMFRFLGILCGIAIRTGSPLSLSLAEPVWKQLAGLQLQLRDLTEFDKEYVPGLMCVRDMDESTLTAADMPFSTPNSTGSDVVLSSQYTSITPVNRGEFIRLALDYRFHEFDQQVQWVREGMAKVVPVPLLSLFTGYELETMVCGSPDIPLNLLKSVASYKNVEPSSDLVTWFWEVMEEFNNQERSLFLRFVWGRTRLPRTIADFRGRDFVIQAIDKYSPADHYLPESYTCFFLLKLPRYSCKRVVREKLKYAIYFCKSIDTDDYARVALTGEPFEEDLSDGVPVPSPTDSFSDGSTPSEYGSDEE